MPLPNASRRRRLGTAGTLALTGLAGLTAAVALSACAATPLAPAADTASPTTSPAPTTASPVTVEELGAGETEATVEVDVAGPVAVTYRRITIAPGAGTGLHCHYGQLIAVVESGEFTHRAPIYPDGVHVYEAGDSVIEGASYVHEGVNEGDEDLVLLVTYVTEEGKPLAETELANCEPTAG
ncbi:cupin domain-containing protein [Agromyces aerolatus]|uniref:cupin domain-containing protein n=1 Tax=Agromyces sp. LY-1074 TaxID=3074080 RepID=UPI0028604D01|nr:MULTISPECIES: cupin domain-containing protein [unclassified Agromyces]MDR5701691.1 cupin domain-containing protein [Agromyces sp. LY-1074]MDR5707962.1 cupin domain-containing protein [Agromyces sp. LY-1358]